MMDIKNLRVLNTRPKHQAEATSDAIKAAGGIPIAFPLLEIKATASGWTHTLPPLQELKHAIFVSPNAVHYFFEQIQANTWPSTIQTYTLGKSSAEALKTYHITNTIIPTVADSEHLLALPALQSVKAQPILLIKGKKGRTLIENTLTARHAKLFQVEVYERCAPNPDPEQVHALWHEDAVDIILITSKTALEHLLTLWGGEAKSWICEKPCLVLSPRLKAAALNAGFKNVSIGGIE